MQGKILGLGIIRGDDGNRYSFSLDDIVNLNEYNSQKLAGYQVDFEIDEGGGGKAKDIFILNKASFWSRIAQDDIKSIRRNFLIALSLYFLSQLFLFISVMEYKKSGIKDTTIIDILNNICLIFSCLFWLFATIGLNRASGSKTLLRNFIIFCVLEMIMWGMPLNWLVSWSGYNDLVNIGIVIFKLVGLSFLFLYAGELAFIIVKRSILWLFYIGLFMHLMFIWQFFIKRRMPYEMFYAMSNVIDFLFAIILFIVFIRFKQIRKYKT